MKWWIDHRDVLVLLMFGVLSLVVWIDSVGREIRVHHREHEVRQFAQQADSLMKDWIGRGCAPRTKAVP